MSVEDILKIVKEKEVARHEQIRNPARRGRFHQPLRGIPQPSRVPLAEGGVLVPRHCFQAAGVVHQWHGGREGKI